MIAGIIGAFCSLSRSRVTSSANAAIVGRSNSAESESPEVRRLDVLTPGPVRVGSRAHQVRIDQGRQSESIFRVTALEELGRLEFAESSDLFRTSYRLDPVGDQTRITFAFQLNRTEFFMRPFEKLIRVAIQDGAGRVVRNIKGLLEREPEQPNGAASA